MKTYARSNIGTMSTCAFINGGRTLSSSDEPHLLSILTSHTFIALVLSTHEMHTGTSWIIEGPKAISRLLVGTSNNRKSVGWAHRLLGCFHEHFPSRQARHKTRITFLIFKSQSRLQQPPNAISNQLNSQSTNLARSSFR